MNDSAQDIVLASASPRRCELLAQLGWKPLVMPVDIDESVQAGEIATEYCLRMAKQKSMAAQQSIQSTRPTNTLPVLTADTVVVVDGQILGKPRDSQDAALTLGKLSARAHHVYSAVSVWYNGQSKSILSTNVVEMAAISEAQIAAYIATGVPMDKAGAYGIQDYAAMWIKRITGSYSSIMGLPLFETTAILNDLGIMSPLELSAKP